MLVEIENQFYKKNMMDLKKYIKSLTNEVSFICICGLLDAFENSILLVEFEDFTKTIWLYKADGIALMIYLPTKSEHDGFRCDPFNFIGKKCMISWPDKEKGALPF